MTSPMITSIKDPINKFQSAEHRSLIMFLQNLASQALWTGRAETWKWSDLSRETNLPLLKTSG